MKKLLIQLEGYLIIVMSVRFFWRQTIFAYVGDALLREEPVKRSIRMSLHIKVCEGIIPKTIIWTLKYHFKRMKS